MNLWWHPNSVGFLFLEHPIFNGGLWWDPNFVGFLFLNHAVLKWGLCFFVLSRAALGAHADFMSDPLSNSMSSLCCFVQIFRARADVISDSPK